AFLEHAVVARDLSFQGQPPGYPPGGRMKEKRGLDYLLGQIRPIITPAQMGQFVPQNRLDFPRFSRAILRGWQEYHGVKESKQNRGARDAGGSQLDAPCHPQLGAQNPEELLV